MGVVEGLSAANVSLLANTTGVDLILSDLLNSKDGGRLVFTVCPAIIGCVLSVEVFG